MRVDVLCYASVTHTCISNTKQQKCKYKSSNASTFEMDFQFDVDGYPSIPSSALISLISRGHLKSWQR
jgi:hypothetical protein